MLRDLLLTLVLVLAGTAPSPYGWRWVSPSGTDWRYRGGQPAGYLPVPTDLAGADSDNLTVDGGVVRALTAQEIETRDFPIRRAAKIAAIDARTEELLESGTFSYASKTFSHSAAQRAEVDDIKADPTQASYPYTVLTTAGAEHALADQAAGLAYYRAGRAAVRSIRIGGTALKAQVWACTTVAQVEFVVDAR